MPDEFRVWKEKVDAVELKKSMPFPTSIAIKASTTPLADVAGTGDESFEPRQAQDSDSSIAKSTKVDSRVETLKAPVYDSQEQAVEAFKEMLADKNVSSVLKMKDVIELCQQDARYNALKTAGEKKQALAEYQVCRH